MYSHDEIYTSLRAAGYTGSDVIDRIWDGKVHERDELLIFLQPAEDKTVIDTVDILARSMPQMSPLYFAASHYWMRLVGHSPAEMRWLAAIFSFLTIPAMYWFCLELFRSRRTAMISTALTALSPFSILLAHDARQYSLLALWILISCAIFLVALRRNKKADWLFYSFALMLGLYSHPVFALTMAAHGFYLLLSGKSRRDGRFGRFLLAGLVGFAAFIPWVLQIVSHWEIVLERLGWSASQNGLSLYIQNWLLIFSSPVFDMYLGPRNIIPYILRLPALLLIGFSLVFLAWRAPRRISVFLLVLFGFATLPFFLSDLLRGGILSIQGRYFVGTNMVILPIIGNLLAEKLPAGTGLRPSKWVAAAVIIIFAQIASDINIVRADNWWTKKHSWIEPQIGYVLNEAEGPVLIVNGLWPTDLGDVLAISLMVDDDVRFLLFPSTDRVEIPEKAPIYWFHETFEGFIDSDGGSEYQATEAVPYFLWRITP